MSTPDVRRVGSRRGRPPKLSRDKIVQAALELGLDSFSMQGIADRLEVTSSFCERNERRASRLSGWRPSISTIRRRPTSLHTTSRSVRPQNFLGSIPSICPEILELSRPHIPVMRWRRRNTCSRRWRPPRRPRRLRTRRPGLARTSSSSQPPISSRTLICPSTTGSM